MYRMILADDERIIREGIKFLDWEANNIKIIGEAKNGVEAMELVDSMEFDVLLTDIRMPGVTGIELAQYLKKNHSNTKTIILSGFGEFEYAKEALKLGVSDYILKPSTPNEIIGTVKRVCIELEKERQANSQMEEITKELNGYKEVVGSEIAKEECETDIKKIIKYIYKHYMEELSLARIAEEFHFNTVYLSAYIKKNTGHTFLEILTSVRMYHASVLLKTTNMKNGEVGIKVGIPDERYFGQVFKKTFNISPYEYKKSNTKAVDTIEEWILKIEKLKEL